MTAFVQTAVRGNRTDSRICLVGTVARAAVQTGTVRFDREKGHKNANFSVFASFLSFFGWGGDLPIAVLMNKDCAAVRVNGIRDSTV